MTISQNYTIRQQMGIQERKERERMQRKEIFLDAALSLFQQNGIAETTMDHIAEKAEYSKGTLYQFFRSKEDIQYEVSIRGAEILNQKLRRSIDQKKSGLQNLESIGWAFISFSKEYEVYFDLFIMFQSIDMSKLNIPIEKVDQYFKEQSPFTIIIKMVEEGIKDGSLRSDLNIVNTATTLWSQMLGLLIVQKYKKEIYNIFDVNEEEIFRTNFDVLVKGVGGEKVTS